jgi:hypothetical protein
LSSTKTDKTEEVPCVWCKGRYTSYEEAMTGEGYCSVCNNSGFMVIGGAGHQSLVKQNILSRLSALMLYDGEDAEEGGMEFSPINWREVERHVQQAIDLITDKCAYEPGPRCVTCGERYEPTHHCCQNGYCSDDCMTNAQMMRSHEGVCHREACVMVFGLDWVLRREELLGVNW